MKSSRSQFSVSPKLGPMLSASAPWNVSGVKTVQLHYANRVTIEPFDQGKRNKIPVQFRAPRS